MDAWFGTRRSRVQVPPPQPFSGCSVAWFIASDWGSEDRRFKSGQPDHFLLDTDHRTRSPGAEPGVAGSIPAVQTEARGQANPPALGAGNGRRDTGASDHFSQARGPAFNLASKTRNVGAAPTGLAIIIRGGRRRPETRGRVAARPDRVPELHRRAPAVSLPRSIMVIRHALDVEL